MKWLDKQVSLYESHFDNYGRAATFREILFTEFSYDLYTIIQLKELEMDDPGYELAKLALKEKLQCYTPAGLLACKAKGRVQEINRSGMLQLDFDYKDIYEYDIEELKRCVFNIPYVGFCGLSCTGNGFYALVQIAEPEKLEQYAEHLFQVLADIGIKVDRSKGKKVENLRYLSYDSNMLVRDNPNTLLIKNFRTKPTTAKTPLKNTNYKSNTSNNGLIDAYLYKIRKATKGERWDTVQHVSYTLGGIGDPSVIHSIKSEIEANPEFNGQEDKYCKCAEDCFAAGLLKPLKPVQ
jgi:hypothetical protein